MAWSSLGTITPDFLWQEFSQPLVGDAVLRITQQYQQSEISGLNKCYLSEYYATGERRWLFTLYPNTTEQRLYDLIIPAPLANAGYVARYLSLKHNLYGVVAAANWAVTVDIWTPDGSTNPVQILDGGLYQ